MSDPENRAENPLQRWSRRKQAAQSRGHESESRAASPTTEAQPPAGARGQPDQPAFDPATLPPIESITATSDIRAFLAPGVPEELARAALRRTWVADPAIRNFVGLAENQWDFTRPDSVPGFGSLELTPELRRVLARIVGEPTEQTPADSERAKQIAPASDTLAPRAAPQGVSSANAALHPGDPSPAQRPSNNDGATQPQRGENVTAPGWPLRRHGGALPK